MRRAVFEKNLNLTKSFFSVKGVKQPTYTAVMRNMLTDIFKFTFNLSNEKIKNSNILNEMKNGGIFLTAHFGNHELLGYRLAEAGVPLLAAAQEQKPKWFNNWLQKKRTYKGKCFAKSVAPHKLLEFIDSGGLFALLADQNHRKGIKSKFMGIEVLCNPLPFFILKHRPNTPVFCGSLEKIIKIPSENFYSHYHAWLEDLILTNPAKWYGWIHNRFNIC